MLKDRSRSQTAPQEGEDTDNLLEENDYNPFATPPDLAKALKHQKATKIGKFDMNQTEKVEICECCNTPTNHKPLPVCGSRLELSSLGAGFPLYFEYVFHCGILLLLLFVTVGIPGLSSNPKGTQCALYKNAARDPCQGGFVINYSLVNMNSRDDWVLGSGLSFLFVFVCMPLVAYCRVAQSKTAEKVDSGVVASSDYTVMVSKIPATETAEQIRAFFEKHGSQSRVASNVKNVNMAYHIGTYVGLVRKKKELEEKIAKGNAPQRVKSQLKAVEKRLEKFEKAVDNNSSTQFTGIAFITFNTEREAAEVVKKFTLTRLQKLWYACCCCFGCGEDKTYNGEYIKVRKAPDPMDVFWENLGYDWWKTMRIRILSFISALILVAMSFGMILGISIWQEQVKKDSASNTSLITFLAFLSSYLVTIINVLIGIFMRKLAGLEKHTTWTYYFVSVGKKLTYAQFFNTALLNVLVQLFKTERFNLWVEGSLVSKVFFLFLLNSFVPSVSYLFNPEFILRLFKRRKMASEGEKSKLTQQQANLLFEGPPVDLAQRYANIQKTLLFTGFYARLVPIGIVFSFAGLILAYWTDKYLLLRRHSRPRALGKELAEDMSNFMQHFIIAFASGSLVFEIITVGYASGFSIVALVFAVLFYLLPDGCCLACCRRSRGVSNHKTYDEARLNFLTDYDRANPVTQEEATRDWIMEISQVYDGKDEKGQNPQNVAAYLQQVPRQTPFVSLANYAQNNLSFRQMHQMNGNSNFNMSFIPRPQQVMLVRQVNPALMNRPGFTPMQLMGPQRIAVPVRLIPQQLQAFYPRVMPNGFIPNLPPRPIIPNHVPQQSPQHVSVDIPKQKPEVAKHLPQQTAPVVQPIFMNQSPQPQHSPASISPLPGNMIQPPTVLVRPPVQMQPQPYPMNQPMMPMNQAPVMQYPGMMPPRNIPVQQVQMMPFGGQPQPGQYGFQPPPQQQFGMQQNMVAPQFGMQQPMMPMQYPMGGQPGFGTNQRF